MSIVTVVNDHLQMWKGFLFQLATQSSTIQSFPSPLQHPAVLLSRLTQSLRILRKCWTQLAVEKLQLEISKWI